MDNKKSHTEVKTPIYGNWKVYHPDGTLMFYGDEERINWYLKRDLAVVINERAIQLTFIPKGKGCAVDLYGSSPKENICVVCGDTDGLTRHHIVPFCYRRFFPEEYKSKNYHDVVPVCGKHHKEYEAEATKLKKEIADQYDMSHEFRKGMSLDMLDRIKIGGMLKCLIERKDGIPPSRIDELKEKVKNYFKIENLPCDLTELFKQVEIPKNKYKHRRDTSKFKVLVSKIENIQEFVEQWRSHFLETMNPRYLPVGWELKKDARRISFIINGK